MISAQVFQKEVFLMIRSHMMGSALILGAALGLFTGLSGTAVAQEKKTKITISGSDTMNLLTQRLAEEFMHQNKSVEISVRGGGSGVGISDLISGLNDIAQASRKIKPGEIESAKANGYNPEEHVVALDGIAIAVHKDNPVDELSLAQLKAIYTGTVKKWNQLNPAWPDQGINLVSREANCGTYDFFKEHVMAKADFANNTTYLAATAAIASAVSNDRNAIGYGGVAYFVRPTGIKVLKIKGDKNSPAISPVDPVKHEIRYDVVQDGTYAISRPLQYYTPEAATGEVKNFLDFAKSPEGQKVVMQMEYIPLATSGTTTTATTAAAAGAGH